MWTCPTCGEKLEDQFAKCWKCANDGKEIVAGDDLVIDLPISTTPSIPGRTCAKTLGVVGGQAILGANFIRDFLAAIRDVTGGRVGIYESQVREARMTALAEMVSEARELGADAVVGVDIDYETIGDSMMMVTASGTAVTLE